MSCQRCHENRGEGIDLLKDRQALQRLTEAAEKAKIELSGVQEAERQWEEINREASTKQEK